MNSLVAEYLQKVKSNIQEVDINALSEAQNNDILVIDVREPQEHAQGMVPNAIPLPRGVLEFNIFNLPQFKDQPLEQLVQTPIYLYCASGGRSACAAQNLQQLGFKKVYSVAGGYKAWQAEND